MNFEIVSLEDVKNEILIDVREPNEFEAGAYDNAKNVPLSKLCLTIDIMQTYDKNAEYVLYCVRGMRARDAGNIMMEGGFKNVKLLDRGYM